MINKGDWLTIFKPSSPDWRRADRGWRVCAIILGKARVDVPEGQMIRQRELWGIKIMFCYWLPFERY